MFGFLALINLRSYFLIAACVSAFLMLFVYFDSSRQLASLVSAGTGNSYYVLGGLVVGFVTTPVYWALTDPFGAIVAGLLWPLAAIWLGLLVFLLIFNLMAPLFGWTLDWGRVFDF